MYDNHIFEIVVAAAVPCVLMLMLWARLFPAHLAKFRQAKRAHQLAILFVLAFAAYSTQKPTPPPVEKFTQILTFSQKGKFFYDLSGKFVPWVQSLVGGAAWEGFELIEAAALDAIAPGTNTLHALAQQAATNDIDRLYLSFNAYAPNDNLAIRVMQWETVDDAEGKFLDALVNFSMVPATNVVVNLEFATAPGVAAPLAAVSNSYPVTESVAGMPCYRYRYQYPATAAQLLPQSDIQLGGFLPDQFLEVSTIIISDGNDYYLPFTGWDDESTETEEIFIRYSEGIAVEIVINGEKAR